MKPNHIRWVLIVMLLVMILGTVLSRAADMPPSVGISDAHSYDPGEMPHTILCE